MSLAIDLIQDYRSALRTLWNNHFFMNLGLRDDELGRDFEKVQPPLFSALVSKRLDPSAKPGEVMFGPAFRVVPALQGGPIPSIVVNRKAVGSASSDWQVEHGPFSNHEINLTLVNFFDWDVRSRRDFRYYLVKIVAFNNRPELIGCEALVDVIDTDVWWDET